MTSSLSSKLTVVGSAREVMFVFLKASPETETGAAEHLKVTWESLVHPLKALIPMLFTEAGMSTLVRLVARSKASPPMVVSTLLAPKAREEREVHSENALTPRLMTALI
jgi:hypothetical protein